MDPHGQLQDVCDVAADKLLEAQERRLPLLQATGHTRGATGRRAHACHAAWVPPAAPAGPRTRDEHLRTSTRTPVDLGSSPSGHGVASLQPGGHAGALAGGRRGQPRVKGRRMGPWQLRQACPVPAALAQPGKVGSSPCPPAPLIVWRDEAAGEGRSQGVCSGCQAPCRLGCLGLLTPTLALHVGRLILHACYLSLTFPAACCGLAKRCQRHNWAPHMLITHSDSRTMMMLRLRDWWGFGLVQSPHAVRGPAAAALCATACAAGGLASATRNRACKPTYSATASVAARSDRFATLAVP